jgi:SRSO17 transposase
MEAADVLDVGARLHRFMGEFNECFGRREPAEHAERYVRGQHLNLPRKSMEPMADEAGIDPRALQKFLGQHRWDDRLMSMRLQQAVMRDHAHPQAIGIIDESSFAKKGDKTPGVQHQHCGSTGKLDNCVVTTHLAYATPDGFHTLLSSALFLPEDWSNDRARCREAGIPDDLVHRTKWEIALELHQEARANGVHFAWLTADEFYGRPVEFHLELSRRGQCCVLEVPRNFWGWCRKPDLLHKTHHGKVGRKLKRKNPAISTVENLAAHSPAFRKQPWVQFLIKEGEKGPVVWEARAAPFYLKDQDGLPTRAHLLIVARNVQNPGEVKYFVSNAPVDTPLTTLLAVAFARWHVERCFQDQKTELGMGHFEVRNYTSLMRHLTLTAVSFLFLAITHGALKKTAGTDPLPGPHCRQRLPEHAGPAAGIASETA